MYSHQHLRNATKLAVPEAAWGLDGGWNGFFSGVVHLPSLACLGSAVATLGHGPGLRWPLAEEGKVEGPISEWFSG